MATARINVRVEKTSWYYVVYFLGNLNFTWALNKLKDKVLLLLFINDKFDKSFTFLDLNKS